jgi:hypothetical protein
MSRIPLSLAVLFLGVSATISAFQGHHAQVTNALLSILVLLAFHQFSRSKE